MDGESKIPKWVWIAGAAAVVIVLALLARSNGASIPTIQPVPADPNIEATRQRALGVRENVASALIGDAFDYATSAAGFSRDATVAGISAGQANVANMLAAQVAMNGQYTDLETVRWQESGVTDRSRINANASISMNAADNYTSQERTRYEAVTSAYRTQTDYELGLERENTARTRISADDRADTRRNYTTNAISQRETAARRKESTDKTVGGVIGDIISGIATVFAFL